MGAVGHAFGRLGAGEARPQRKAAADGLGDRHDVGRDADRLIDEQRAGAAHAALHLVEDQQQAVPVADRAQALEESRRHHMDAAFALDRLDHDRRGLVRDGLLHQIEIAGSDGVEPHVRPQPLHVFRVASGEGARQRAAVKGALERDDAIAFGMAGNVVVTPRHLEGAFAGFHPGIAEEHGVGKGVGDQPLGQMLLPRHAVEIRGMPQFPCLLGQRRHQSGIGVTEGVHRNAGPEVQITSPVLGEKVATFAPDERDIRPLVGRQYDRKHSKPPHLIRRCG